MNGKERPTYKNGTPFPDEYWENEPSVVKLSDDLKAKMKEQARAQRARLFPGREPATPKS